MIAERYDQKLRFYNRLCNIYLVDLIERGMRIRFLVAKVYWLGKRILSLEAKVDALESELATKQEKQE